MNYFSITQGLILYQTRGELSPWDSAKHENSRKYFTELFILGWTEMHPCIHCLCHKVPKYHILVAYVEQISCHIQIMSKSNHNIVHHAFNQCEA